MSIAIVILNWNGKSLLERFLPVVIRYSADANIYVADNASTDSSVNFLRERYPQVTILQNKENGGFSKGYNQALAHLKEDIFCLLNSDVEVTQGWLDPIAKLFYGDPKIAIVQPKIRDLLKRDHFEYAGAAGGYLDRLGYPFCRGRIFQTLETDKGQYDDDREIFWATGACMFVRKTVYRELNGLDEDYFAHQEEVDFCWRAKNRGHKVFYCASSTVYHLGGSTLSNMNPKKTFLNFRNSLFSITKNLPKRKAFVIILLRLLLDGVAAARFVLQLRIRHFWAILRAHISFYRHFPKMFRKRKNAGYIKKYYATTSIVWSYFVHQIKSFNNLVKD